MLVHVSFKCTVLLLHTQFADLLSSGIARIHPAILHTANLGTRKDTARLLAFLCSSGVVVSAADTAQFPHNQLYGTDEYMYM